MRPQSYDIRLVGESLVGGRRPQGPQLIRKALAIIRRGDCMIEFVPLTQGSLNYWGSF